MINLGFALGYWWRVRLLIGVVLPFVAQQLWSHGHDLLSAAAQGRFDWPSLLVLFFLPASVLEAVQIARAARSPGNSLCIARFES